MAKVIIKGMGKVTLPREVALELKELKNDPRILPNARYSDHGLDFRKDEIGPIFLDDFEDNDREASSERKQENEAYYKQVSADHEKEVRRLVNLSPDLKAKDTRLAELVFMTITGQTAPETFKEIITERQHDYFRQHPKHPYAAISYQDLVPAQNQKGEHIRAVMPGFVLGKVHDLIQSAFVTANQLRLI